MRGLGAFAATLLAAGALVAGCGDDDDETTTGATGATGAAGSGTLEEYVAQGDAICNAGDKEIDEAAQAQFGGGGEPTDAEVEQFATETVIPSIQEQVDAISDIPPPEGEEGTVQEFLDSAQQALDEIDADPGLVAQGEDAGGTFAETNSLAADLGFENCGD